jgi:hypothetical protein
MFGGTFEPAYLLTISPLPQYMQPTTNKRNAALTQSFMSDVLGVPPERGIVHFKAIAEDNMAHCGKTVMAHIEHEEDPLGLKRGVERGLSRSMHRKSFGSGGGEKRKSLLGRMREEDEPLDRHPSTKTTKSAKSARSLRNLKGAASPSPPLPTSSPAASRPPSSGFGLSINGQLPNARPKSPGVRPKSPMKPILKATTTTAAASYDRSFVSPPPPPIPVDKAPPKVSKRKSLVAIFRR